MKPFARGALIKLSAEHQEPGLKSKTIDLNSPEIQEQATAKMAERLNDVAIENERLRAQVDELLPWAKSGALNHKDNHDDIVALVEINWELRPLHPAQARELLDRIAAGEFGEVAS